MGIFCSFTLFRFDLLCILKPSSDSFLFDIYIYFQFGCLHSLFQHETNFSIVAFSLSLSLHAFELVGASLSLFFKHNHDIRNAREDYLLTKILHLQFEHIIPVFRHKQNPDQVLDCNSDLRESLICQFTASPGSDQLHRELRVVSYTLNYLMPSLPKYSDISHVLFYDGLD